MRTIKEITGRLAAPGPDYRGIPFWSWNSRIDANECRRQICVLAEMGFGGFFIHSRTGLATEFLGEEWFDCVRASVDEARKLGLRAWMYDEDRYPSGTAGGKVTAQRRFRARHVAFEAVAEADRAAAARRPGTLAWFAEVPQKCRDDAGPQDGAGGIASYRRLSGARDTLRDGEVLVRYFVESPREDSWFNGQTYLDTLNPAAVREFVRVAYEPYARAFGENLGAAMPGCFTDEPSFAHFRPWTGAFRREFSKACGYDILDRLPEAFKVVGGEMWSGVRHDYVATATSLFVRAYSKTIGRWCEGHGALFTGHVLEEDSLARQTLTVGSAMRFYEFMQAPGIDQLCEIWNIYATAKQCSSAAHQFGRDFRLAECCGVTGWDFPAEGHKAIGDWLMALGINHRCQHLAWYSMEGSAKRDYPASIFRQSPWFSRYKALEDSFARLGEALADGEEIRPLLVVLPVEGAWGYHLGRWTPEVTALDREHFAVLGNLLGGHVDFDYGDEDILSRHGRAIRRGKPRLRVGRARYDAVLVPKMETIRQTTLALLSDFADAGGRVFFLGDPPSRLDAAASAVPAAAFAAFTRVDSGSLVQTLAPLVRRVSISQDGRECDEVLVHLRSFPDGLGLFVCNTSCPMPDAEATILAPRVSGRRTEYPGARVRLAAPRRSGRVFEMDIETGAVRPVRSKYAGGAFEFAAPLGRLQSRFFFVSREDIATVAPPARSRRPRDIAVPTGPMRYRLHEPNALVLDGATWRVGDCDEQPFANVLDIDDAIRTGYLGVAARRNQMRQPWCEAGGAPAKTIPVTLKFRFSWKGVDPVKAGARLALERPGIFGISLNGVAVAQPPADGPWWVDPCLRLVDLPAGAIRDGENTIELRCAGYHERLPGLEALFLVGEFGVSADGAAVIPLPGKLRQGDVCGQGLPNYSGNISYFIKPRVPKTGACRIRIDRWKGFALGFRLNGGEEVFRPWPPYEAVFDDGLRRDGTDEIEIIVYGHRRNAFGPFYLKGGEVAPGWCGPPQLRSTEEFPRRALTPFGLGAEP